MKEKISIKEKIIVFFLHFDKNVQSFFMKRYPQLIGVVAFIFLLAITYNIDITYRMDQARDNVVIEFLEEQDEELLQQTDGKTYATTEEIIESVRVHGSNNSYMFYFSSASPTEPYIMDAVEHEWLTKQPDIPPLIGYMATELELGVVESFDDGEAVIDGVVYQTTLDGYSLTINDKERYTLSPILTNRVENFVEDYVGSSNRHNNVLRVVRMDDYELIYFENGEETYQLRSYFNDSAEISEVVAGHELIKRLCITQTPSDSSL